MTDLPSDAPSLPPEVSRWLAELATVRRYSGHTLAAYRRDMIRLVEECPDKPLNKITAHDLRRILSRFHAAGVHPRSLSRMLSSWRSFFRWWIQRERLSVNPADGVRAPRASRPLPKALSVDQTMALLESPASSTRSEELDLVAIRDRAMFELLYSSGLRLSELIGLDTHYLRREGYESRGWLHLNEAEVYVLGKGRKQRTVPVGAPACEALRQWLEVRAALVREPDEPALFVGTRGRRIAPRTVQQQLKRWAQRAGLAAHVHPHMLRHSFASHVLQSAQDLRAVQEMLGHASISSTQIYTRLDFQHLAAVYDRAHPRATRRGHRDTTPGRGNTKT